MLVVAIILLVLLLLALLRVGIIIEYDSDGLGLWVKVGFIKLRVKTDGVKKPKKKKEKKDKKSFKPGSLRDFLEILKSIKEVLSRLRRRLLIKTLVIHYTSADEDPAKTAIGFGTANAVFGAVIPILEQHFRIKKRDLRAAADFDSQEPGIYAKISISIAVWEIVYVLFALLPLFKVISADTTQRKGVEKNGKATNKQPNGNHNAENKRDD
ncbi:MAG: DUF2953 domain-containing protein [Oscillospiraceae bacterium]|nr:DUF2953 domain-containing protein [Oscillospiraceae bacterium]